MPRQGVEQVGATLERLLRRLGLERAVRERLSLVVWPEVVGPYAARHTRPLLVRRGVLLVQVSASVWAQELSLMKARLLAGLNERLGGRVLKDLRFSVDPGVATSPAREEAVAGKDPPEPEVGGAWEEEAQALASCLGEEAAARWKELRRLALRRRRSLLARGWRRCPACESFGPGGVIRLSRGEGEGVWLCSHCQAQGIRNRVEVAKGALLAAPWLLTTELLSRVPGLRPGEASLARRLAGEEMRIRLKEQAASALEGRTEAKEWLKRAQEYVLLVTGLPAARLDERRVEAALGDLLPLWRQARSGLLGKEGKAGAAKDKREESEG